MPLRFAWAFLRKTQRPGGGPCTTHGTEKEWWYLSPPSWRREGLGQIEVLVQDRMTTVRALTDNDTRIGNRTAVKVVELVDERTLLVETLSPKSEDTPNTDDCSSGDSNQNPNS